VNAILKDRILVDLIRQLDDVRGDFERADDYELPHFRTLVDNALGAATDYFVQLREQHLMRVK